MKRFIVCAVMAIALMVPAKAVATSEECSTSTGSYGQTTTTCKVLGEVTSVTHSVVGAGIGGFSFWSIAIVLAGVAALSFGIAKLAERTYWFD